MDWWQLRRERCKGCELCVAFCSLDCLEMEQGLNAIGYHPAHLADPDRCNGCGLCADMCPESAITVFRRRKAKAKAKS